ncbi:hypothetical protein FHS35_003602 [Streptomyces umbrinus]|uniref:hypothetical protein n=1 Tax=Streptomyces TaxID=1883 RepID=UPI00167DA001|nr:hypothetical protein [Streptomyces umbrinus]MCR3726750.1 hypothetical protein [Streptomyces umbrinus]GHH33988.1 hypothetical protein GCM10018775_05960 [Streptomyces umbrinus]
MITFPPPLSFPSQLHVHGTELIPAPGSGAKSLRGDGPTTPNLDYDMPFTAVVMGTEAVDTTPAEPGTLLPGTR